MDPIASPWLFQTSALAKSYRADESAAVGDTRHGVRFGPIRIPRGGVIALVGESGTGKTTLFNLLAGLDDPDQPEVLPWWRRLLCRGRLLPQQYCAPGGPAEPPSILLDLDGIPIDLVASPRRFPRERVGFVFQSGYLLHHASAGLNLALPSAQQGRRAERDALGARLQALGIEAAELDERAWKFSGGEAQRIAFVRAIAHDPVLVFADEPTSNVDYRNAVAIMQQLRDWVRDAAHPGRTVLWITHDLRLAAAVADAVLVLHRGNGEPVQPVCLPGDARADLDARVETLQRWTYDKQAMAEDAPPPFPGLATAAAMSAVDGSAALPRSGLWKRTSVRLGAILKVGLSEVFSRHPAQRLKSVRTQVNRRLSVAGGERGGNPLLGLFAWLASFGQRTAVLALILITVLGMAGLGIYDLVDDHFERSVNDPRNCHVIIKTTRGAGHGACYGDLDCLSTRPWLPQGSAEDIVGPIAVEGADRAADDSGWGPDETLTTGPLSRASCRAGAAAYGRIYARGWNIAVADDGHCPERASSSVLLLTADDREPIWTQVRLLTGRDGRSDESLAAFVDAQPMAYNDQIFLAAEQVKALGFDDLTRVVDRTLCLYETGWPDPVQLRIHGVLDEVPNWERNLFGGYIPSYTYDAVRASLGRGAGLVRDATHIALYFDSDEAEALRTFLNDEGYVFVAENLQKIGRLVSTAGVFKGIVTGFLGLIGLLLIMLTAMSVLHYLSANAQSFALLKAYGMNWRFMFGTLLVEISVGWLVAVAMLGAVLLGAALLGPDAWWRFEELVVSADMLWRPFLLSAAAVWLLSVGVSLALTLVWWRQNRYVADVLKAG